MRVGGSLLCCGLLALAVGAGCTRYLPSPPVGDHDLGTPVPVPYPPPPAKPEVVPPQPSEDAVWVDGTWRWTGRNYAWESGRWLVPQPGDYHAPAMTVRRRNGELMYFAGTWHPGGKPVSDDAVDSGEEGDEE
jgi:hypothetical protein